MQPKRFPFGSWISMGRDGWDIDLAERVREWSEIGFALDFSAQVTDDPAGELAQWAMVAGAFGVPMAMVGNGQARYRPEPGRARGLGGGPGAHT